MRTPPSEIHGDIIVWEATIHQAESLITQVLKYFLHIVFGVLDGFQKCRFEP